MLYCVPMYTSLFTNQVHYLSNYSEGYVQLDRFLCNYISMYTAVYSTTQEYITYLSRSITKSSSSIMHGTGNWVKYVLNSCFNFSTNSYVRTKIQQTKMLVTGQRFGDLFLFGLVWQQSSVQTKYNKGRFKVMATYLQQ